MEGDEAQGCHRHDGLFLQNSVLRYSFLVFPVAVEKSEALLISNPFSVTEHFILFFWKLVENSLFSYF